MQPLRTKIFTGLATFLLCTSTFSLTLNKKQPYYFEANSVFYDNNTHQVIYVGNVTLRQGSTRLAGDHLRITLSKNNHILTLNDQGHPATYTSVLTGHPGRIHAFAETIFYDAVKKVITLTGHAKVTQKGNTIEAAHIVYNMQKGTIRTTGNHRQPNTHIAIMPQSTLQYSHHTQPGPQLP